MRRTATASAGLRGAGMDKDVVARRAGRADMRLARRARPHDQPVRVQIADHGSYRGIDHEIEDETSAGIGQEEHWTIGRGLIGCDIPVELDRERADRAGCPT
jgi:hypothetical protein